MDDKKQLVIILDPRGVISNDKETLNRHISYGTKLTSIDPGKKLVIFTSSNQDKQTCIPKSMELIQFKASRIPIEFSAKIAKLIKSEYAKNEMVFVVGDPWESFLAYKLVMLRLRKRFRVQVQIHAELANPDWYLDRIPNYLKYQVSKFALKQANQIRTVSKLQQKDLCLKLNLPVEICKLIPPPLNIDSHFDQNRQSRPRSIGFVGRIAKDRGTRTLIKFCRDLNKLDQSFKVEVAGTGPDFKILQQELFRILGDNRVTFHGYLNSSRMSALWSKVGVLVSLSRTESYGRTIREAAFSGVPVWSLETSGYEQLREEINESSLGIYRDEMLPSELLNIFNRLLSSDYQHISREQIMQSNDNRIGDLCESWIDLFERSSL